MGRFEGIILLALGVLVNACAPTTPVKMTPAEITPGTSFRECPECPEMVVVPAGSFEMGDLSGSGDSDERPIHKVTILRPFAVGRYEVTFDQWDACVGESGCERRWRDNRWGRGSRPVLYVSWKDAKEYVAWLSRKTGKPYRLLSEAEWEYAARAGTTTKYYWGDNLNLVDWISDYRNPFVRGLSYRTLPVGSLSPNGFGLHDMLGNVHEWVEDCYHNSYNGAPTDGGAWTSGDCGKRVVRGGSIWSGVRKRLRSAFRSWNNRDYGNTALGFRVARTLP